MEDKVLNFINKMLFFVLFVGLSGLMVFAYAEAISYFEKGYMRDGTFGLGLGLVLTAVTSVLAMYWSEMHD